MSDEYESNAFSVEIFDEKLDELPDMYKIRDWAERHHGPNWIFDENNRNWEFIRAVRIGINNEELDEMMMDYIHTHQHEDEQFMMYLEDFDSE